jgi:hypothetical protein
MKTFTTIGLLFALMTVNQLFAQDKGDNPNLDQIPQYLRERGPGNPDAPLSSVITINNWDNYSLGVDFAENNMAENPNQPSWFFTAYNTNAPHHTENGIDWLINAANFGTTVAGDPVVAYDSIGNLFYENMYGSISGCKVISSTNNGVSWTAPVTAIAGVDKNWMACDQTAGPYANYVYTTMTSSSGGNFARSTNHGVSFSNTFTPTTQTLPGMMVCVGPEANVQGGAVYVVTNSGTAFNSLYTFYKSTNGGSTFTLKSSKQYAKYVGTDVSGRNSVQGMRTRPYPMIAADNSYGPNRGNLYVVYATNDPPGNGNKPNIYCHTSTDGGATWNVNPVQVNDDANSQNNHQWHPAIWCDKETGKLYVMWMDTRDTPTSDSAYIYATYSTDGGATFAPNQRISNKKMKINCTTCGGGGTPRYQGDYNGVVSNKKGAMVGWTDFRTGTFQSMTGYFPDFAMAIDKATDTLYTPQDNTIIQVSVPEVKLYTDTVLLSASIIPAPTEGSITFEYPDGNTITSFPASKPVRLVLAGNVPPGNYSVTFLAAGPNGTPAHRRSAIIKVLIGGSGYSLTGTVTYANAAQTQMSGVVVALKDNSGTVIATTTTNATGGYTFSGLLNGNYTLEPSTTKPWGGVTAADVLLFKKHIANISYLTGIFLASGDVNASGSLSAADVLLIKKRIATVTNSFAVGDWLFNNTPVTISGSNVTQNFNGLCFADANGSYLPPLKGTSAPGQPQHISGVLTIGSAVAMNGAITIPVFASEVENLGSFQYTLLYDPSKLTFTGADHWFAGIDNVVVGNPQPGKLTFVWAADANGITLSNEKLVDLQFTSNSLETSSLAWSDEPTTREFADYDGVVFAPVYKDGAVGSTLGIESTANSQLVIYPNPARDFIMIRSTEDLQSVKIFNNLGVLVFDKALTTKEIRVSSASFPAGLYLVQVDSRANRICRSILIEK